MKPQRAEDDRPPAELSLEEVQTGELAVPETPIRVVLSEMFAELDRV